ncbi:outer membrane beta-barrel protein [Paradesertivirga mongoliensis]|uniref:Outer membrane beta-barrel protein n=1 Tax=Paradesertivirga mongoliensis TaxID=2100740 RepID=A0ABW4ZQX1_9SPHI|nr:TonB dependent receptor [Pedobacter mongoliensis]
MKNILLPALCVIIMLASANNTQAQNKSISGKVTDEKRAAAEFVTVALLKARDSALLKTSLTDALGIYKFDISDTVDLLISVTAVGYEKAFSKPISKSSGNTVEVPVIALQRASKSLKEVTVTIKKPFVERRADKLIVNVEGSAVAEGNTALEVLRKAPGVSLDKDDNISMNGKNSVLVMIDGKPTYMSNADLANMLRAMQSTQIETIELITNPSAKYDAAGNGGIINIKTKRDKSMGVNGSINLGSGYGRTSKYNGSTNLNFRKGKINLFGNYNYSNRGSKSDFELNRKVTAAGIITNFEQNNVWNARRNNNGYKAGIDLFLNKNTTIGVLVNGYNNSADEKTASGTSIFNQVSAVDSAINVAGRNKQHYANNAYNLNFKTTLDTSGRELTIDADYSKYNGELNEFRDSYYLNFSNSPPVEFINNLAPAEIEILSGKLDYTHPLSKSLKLEAGWKSSWVTTDNNLRFSTLTGSTWNPDKNRSNHFIYKENINAAYLNLNKTYKNTSLQMGLRAEHTNSNGNSVTISKEVKRDYIEFFPSISLSQKLGKDHQLGASYSRRIDRPGYDKLNPFIFLLDKYTFEQGNPLLNPQFTNSSQISYTYKGSTTATLSYSKTRNVMTQVTEQNDATKETFVMERNLDNQTVYSLNIYAPIKLAKWWNLNSNTQVFNMGFTADVLGERLKASQTVFQVNVDNQITITKTLGAELSSWYMSPLQYGIFKIRNSPYVNAGLKKSFENNKLSLKLNLNDIFNSMRNRGSTNFANMDFNFNNKWESRVLNFSLSYRFGSKDIKPERRRSTGLESEANRMKN